MSQTPDDLLKKLKPTKTFVVDGAAIRALAELARDLGPEEFVKRWAKVTTPKPTRKPPPTDGEKTALAAAKGKVATFGTSRKLTSGQTATALHTYASERHELPAPTKAASGSSASMVGWLATKLSVGNAVSLVDSFIAHYGPSTSVKHKLPSEG
jgi:hypothetical protein